VVSLVACTLLGIFVGVGLLSNNFLVRSLSAVYVEIFRNTPLLIQLLFIYRTFTLLLPAPRQSIFSPEWLGENSVYILNARGFYFPALIPTESVTWFWVGLIAGVIAFIALRYWRTQLQERTGQPAQTLRYALLPALLILAAGYLLSGTPFTVDYPALDRLNVVGGMNFSIAFVSLFIGLTLYTAAFVADIVRAGIQAVPYGQIEAARAQGFSRGQVLNLIVLPQALRLIVPPLGNQYVNLSKNSSLAVAVTYVDVYRVAALANNESGQAVPFFVGLMLVYLAISLLLSLIMNSVNNLTRVRTR
jgi:general L-amino acid transport system permease protein